MRTLAILFLTMVFSIGLNAQNPTIGKVVLCVDYDRITGAPIDAYSAWDIPSDGKGGYIYMVYSQESIIKDPLTIYIDKKTTGEAYKSYSTIQMNNDVTSAAKNWAMYDLNFKEEGDFRISVIGKNQVPLGITYADIKFAPATAATENSGTTEAFDPDNIDTYYYEYSWIDFGTGIDEGVLIDKSNEFNLKGREMEIMTLLENDEPLYLKEIVVSVYTGDDYKEEVSTETFTVGDLEWTWISFPITVSKKGKYVVDVYSQDDIYVNSGYFEIK
jgi:hypothetical protein